MTSAKFVETSEDDGYRLAIANLILTELDAPSNQHFVTQNGFAGWARREKKLLRGLFGGQGMQRLARIVAWYRREQTVRRDPSEMLCYFADLFRDETMQELEPILVERWASLSDVLRSCLLDGQLASILLRPMTGDELPSVVRTTLIVLTSN